MRDYNETKFKELLPAKIRVDIHPSQDGGFFCEIKTFPGCFAQGENLFELMEMINDAVYTYLDIPQKYTSRMPGYNSSAKKFRLPAELSLPPSHAENSNAR
jgi:predicted RNase H-like HicB family nuclease